MSFMPSVISNCQQLTFKFPFAIDGVTRYINFLKLMITKEMYFSASTIATSNTIIVSHRFI